MKRVAIRVVCAVGACMVAAPVVAQGTYTTQFPTKPVRVIVPQTPGSSADFFARLVGDMLSERWSVPVVVDNRPGAGGSIAMEALARANADGYTIAVTTEG